MRGWIRQVVVDVYASSIRYTSNVTALGTGQAYNVYYGSVRRAVQVEEQVQTSQGVTKETGYAVSNDNKKCPECGTVMTYSYEPSWQEYPGAMPEPAYHYWECPTCEYCRGERGTCIAGQENTRGW